MPRSRSDPAAALLIAALAGCGAAPASPTVRCPADRAIVIASRADLAGLAGCTTAAGVTVRSGAALDISALGALATISGDLVIGPTVAIEEITLRGLRRVDGAIRVVSNGLLHGLYLPGLESAGAIEVAGNPTIVTVSLPRLGAVRRALRITGNAGLELVDVSVLATVGGELALAGARLTLVEADELRRAASVEIDAPNLPSEVADRVRAAAAGP